MDLLISITPIEGRIDRRETEHFNCFYAANTGLLVHSKVHNAPERGNGYLKTKVSVAIDGLDYTFRYDMVDGGAESGLGEFPNLKQTVLDRLKFYAGKKCPYHMAQDEYRTFLDTYLKKEDAEQYDALLSKLEKENGY